ncbi:MAG: hypothetical protein M0R80_22860, partial [Proteobacteria bacterium]|nr:hypothetical protein [Pseudomonadota bacterium]
MPVRTSEIFLFIFVVALAAAGCGPWSARHEAAKAPTEAPAPAPPAPELIDVAELEPYFATALDGEAARALVEDRIEDARAGFDAIAALSAADPELGSRARFLA